MASTELHFILLHMHAAVPNSALHVLDPGGSPSRLGLAADPEAFLRHHVLRGVRHTTNLLTVTGSDVVDGTGAAVSVHHGAFPARMSTRHFVPVARHHPL